MAELRRGWTTGACAAAAARAACERLFTGRLPDPVTIDLPRGLKASFALAETGAWIGVEKDAGDDPDATHGAIVRARLHPAPPGSGVRFRAGPGVGTVTLPGLPLAVGEPAINPGPRAIIADNLRAVADEYGLPADIEAEIGIGNGEALALKTANARLGIEGGLSVLGTTGVVIPYSCAAWIHAVHRGVDVARAAGLDRIGAATGRGSEEALQALLGLPAHGMIDMGDFAGALLKYLRRRPVARLSLAGGFGKLSKLAAGHLDLHSDRAPVDIPRLAAELEGARRAGRARGAQRGCGAGAGRQPAARPAHRRAGARDGARRARRRHGSRCPRVRPAWPVIGEAGVNRRGDLHAGIDLLGAGLAPAA